MRAASVAAGLFLVLLVLAFILAAGMDQNWLVLGGLSILLFFGLSLVFSSRV